MKRAGFTVLLLLLWPLWITPGQQSGGSKSATQSGEPVQENNQQPGQPLTNVSIVELVKGGLSEDTIISIINTQPGKYVLDPQYVSALKEMGVSDKIIAAMQKRMPLTGQDTPSIQVPDTPGLYCFTNGKLDAVIGQAVLFRRTGSRLAGAVTFGIVSGKINIKIPGSHAGTHLGTRPVFYYHTGPDDLPGVLSLVPSRLKVSNGNRQLEAKASGAWRASEGISINSQIQTNTSLASADVYKVEPQGELKAGEYAFYLRTAGASTQDAFLYAFSVE